MQQPALATVVGCSLALAATSPSHWREVWESGSSLVITHLLIAANRDAEAFQPAVANEVTLPDIDSSDASASRSGPQPNMLYVRRRGS